MPPDDARPIMSSGGPLFVTPTSCQCAFTHRLPCRHMFARRQQEGLPSYDITLVDKRWTASYCGIIPDVPTSSTLSLRRSQTPTQAALTSHQKYRQVVAVASELVGLASEVGHVEFLERLDLLKKLRTELTNAVVPVVSLVRPASSPATVTPLEPAHTLTRRKYNVQRGENVTRFDCCSKFFHVLMPVFYLQLPIVSPWYGLRPPSLHALAKTKFPTSSLPVII